MQHQPPPESTSKKMKSMFHPLGSPACLAALVSLLALAARATPRHVYLTWQGDTSRTMTVNYQTLEPSGASVVHFDTKPRNGERGAYRYMAVGRSHQVPGLDDGRKIHWVELEKLSPGQTYYFIAGDPQTGFTTERKFRTVPDGSEKLRFVTAATWVPVPTSRRSCSNQRSCPRRLAWSAATSPTPTTC
jgi:hypothetical protein